MIFIAGDAIRFAAIIALREDGMVYEARPEIAKERMIGIAVRSIARGETVHLTDDEQSDIVTRQSIKRVT